MTRKCILDSKRKGGCASCPPTCGHYIAMYGLSGKGGRVGAAGLPDEYKHVTLNNTPVRESQAKIYGLLDDYVATFGRQFDER